MDNIQNKLDSTISYYDQNIDTLYDNYEQANMLPLHKSLQSNLLPHTKVLDIGFGSGRDLAFLQNLGLDIWGVDPSFEFVEKAQQRFPHEKNHFVIGSLPDLDLPTDFKKKFDAVMLIAVWMHIPKELYEASIKEICMLLKKQAKVIISYSITPRIGENERFFEDVDSDILQSIFEQYGCKKLIETTNDDGLSERSIIWKTEVYQYD